MRIIFDAWQLETDEIDYQGENAHFELRQLERLQNLHLVLEPVVRLEIHSLLTHDFVVLDALFVDVAAH